MMSDKTLEDLKVDAHIAVLHTKVDALIEKQKELTARVRANEKVVAAVTLLGTVVLAVIGAGYFAPSAEACSPRLDGEPTYCPPMDDIVTCQAIGCVKDPVVQPQGINDKSFTTDFPNYWMEHNQEYHQVTLVDTREEDKWDYGTVIQRMREWKNRQERESVEDMINSSLAEYENGSNDSTKQEELLQLPSDRDS